MMRWFVSSRIAYRNLHCPDVPYITTLSLQWLGSYPLGPGLSRLLKTMNCKTYPFVENAPQMHLKFPTKITTKHILVVKTFHPTNAAQEQIKNMYSFHYIPKFSFYNHSSADQKSGFYSNIFLPNAMSTTPC